MRKIAAIFVVLLIFCTVSSAFASDDDRPSKYGLRFLLFRPVDGDLRNVTDSNWIGAGVDIYLKKDEDDRPTRYVSLGYVSSGDGFVKGKIYPLTYTIVNRRPISADRNSYRAIGAGIYSLKLESPSLSRSSFKPGLNLAYGQEVKDTYFGELRVDLIPEFETFQWTSISLNIGTRVSL